MLFQSINLSISIEYINVILIVKTNLKPTKKKTQKRITIVIHATTGVILRRTTYAGLRLCSNLTNMFISRFDKIKLNIILRPTYSYRVDTICTNNFRVRKKYVYFLYDDIELN